MSLLVINASPLIGLAKARQLDLLPQLYSQILIPQAVFEEVVSQGKGRPGAEEISRASWIEIRSPRTLLAHSESLGKGEAEAIALAKELEADLLIDDRAARLRAGQEGIQCLTVADLLEMAHRAGLITIVLAILASWRFPEKDHLLM